MKESKRERKSGLFILVILIVVIALSSQVLRISTRYKENPKVVFTDKKKLHHKTPVSQSHSIHDDPDVQAKDIELNVEKILNEEAEYNDVIEKDQEFEEVTFVENQKKIKADWMRYSNVTKGQNCSDEFRLFSEGSNRPIVAISSFPGSGNTWARHLLHMATGYWTGNRRSSNKLKAAGWAAEDNDCKDRTTVAQKTHRLSHNKACEFERGLVLIRNPFDAIMAAYNHHMAGKTGEPPMSVFEGEKWPNFISDWAARWFNFHYEWFNNFQGPVQISCFDRLVHDPVEEVGHWLNFLELDHRRLGCINHDPVGQFYRKKTHDYSHLFPTKEAKLVKALIKKVSKMIRDSNHEDCTQYFKYDKCC